MQDFTMAVMDVDFSPTGREFVAGSYDRSIRIFRYNGGHSHEVYTTKRMQRVFATKFTGDSTYIVSGSDDFNMRVWKVRSMRFLPGSLPVVTLSEKTPLVKRSAKAVCPNIMRED
jgi:WD repeat and SOF domain-containing protein 1